MNIINITYTNGCRVEITGKDTQTYTVNFTNKSNGQLLYSTVITNNMWCSPLPKYFVNWDISISNSSNELLHTSSLCLKKKKVLLSFKSSSLGDTLAWIPYVDEFRKRQECIVYCSTFHNSLFENVYSDITFIPPDIELDNIDVRYELGWFYDSNGNVDLAKNPLDFRTQPLQKTASDILGLNYNEIHPKLKLPTFVNKEYPKLAVIATQSTAQSKYWNNPNGWNGLVSYLKSIGYTVACIDKHSSFGTTGNFNTIPNGVLDWTGDYPLEKRMEQILSADVFIGLGSGLSWLSWALGQKTVLISGFSEPYSEMEGCIRIKTPVGKCTGCFNRVRLDAGDWMWCPEHKGTERQFECTKSITSDMVIEQLRGLL